MRPTIAKGCTPLVKALIPAYNIRVHNETLLLSLMEADFWKGSCSIHAFLLNIWNDSLL